jgi:hypothetical protein
MFFYFYSSFFWIIIVVISIVKIVSFQTVIGASYFIAGAVQKLTYETAQDYQTGYQQGGCIIG